MSFTAWALLDAASTPTAAIAVTSTSTPHTPDGQCAASPIDALPFLLVGAVIGLFIGYMFGEMFGRRAAVKRLAEIMKRGGKRP